jgi:hypothetical protein
VTITTEFVGGVAGVETLARLNAFVQDIVTSRLSFHANRMLDAHLGRVGDVNYLVEVDGAKAVDRSSFATAKRRITIRFTDELLRLAASELVAILRSAIASNGATGRKGDWINKSAMAAKVAAFYGGKDKPLKRISATAEIPDFGPGDVLLLVPIYDAQMFANAKKFGATGLMAKAAAQIRKLLVGTISSRSAAKRSYLRVSAQRSRAVFNKLASGSEGRSLRTRDNSVIKMTVPRPGMDSAWCIAIRYREVAK